MDWLEALRQYRCPGYMEYPSVPLYKDQVIGFLSQAVAPFFGPEQPPVSAAMINNYVKLKVIAPPERKKYDRNQLICLYVIFLLKQVLSIDEIRRLLELEFPRGEMEASYARFCARLEGELESLSGGCASLPSTGHPLLEAAVRAFVCQRYAVILLAQASPLSPAPEGSDEMP